jgi:Cysteine-rich secretory protein family
MVRVLAFAAATLALALPAVADDSGDAMAATNKYRGEHGMAPLSESPSLFSRCMEHSKSMAARGSLYHTALGGGVMAENVAMRSSGDSAGTAMVSQWIDSPGHEENLRSDYPCGATALYESGGQVWGTQMFGECTDGDTAPAHVEEQPKPKHHDGAKPAEAPVEAKHYGDHQGDSPDEEKHYDNAETPNAKDYYNDAEADSPDGGHYYSEYYKLNERCMGAPGYPNVPYKPCEDGLVCVGMQTSGWGKFCVPPRYKSEHSEEYGETREIPTKYGGEENAATDYYGDPRGTHYPKKYTNEDPAAATTAPPDPVYYYKPKEEAKPTSVTTPCPKKS